MLECPSLFSISPKHTAFFSPFLIQSIFWWIVISPPPPSSCFWVELDQYRRLIQYIKACLKQLIFPWKNATSLLFHAVHHSSPSAWHCYGSGTKEWFFILFLSPTTRQKKKKIHTHTFEVYKCRGLMSRMAWLHIFSPGIGSTSWCERIVTPACLGCDWWHCENGTDTNEIWIRAEKANCYVFVVASDKLKWT